VHDPFGEEADEPVKRLRMLQPLTVFHFLVSRYVFFFFARKCQAGRILFSDVSFPDWQSDEMLQE